MNREKLYL